MVGGAAAASGLAKAGAFGGAAEVEDARVERRRDVEAEVLLATLEEERCLLRRGWSDPEEDRSKDLWREDGDRELWVDRLRD